MASPTTTPKLLVRAVLSEGAAAEDAIAHTRRRTAHQKAADRARTTCSLYTRDCVCTSPQPTTCVINECFIAPYAVTRSARPTKQGCGESGHRDGRSRSAPGRPLFVFSEYQWILDTVEGYRIDFLKEPWQGHRPPFTEKEQECMQAEIQSMLDKQTVSVTGSSHREFYSQMFLVPKKDGRHRPVINLKRLNQLVKTEHFKMEGIHMLKNLLKAEDWMAEVDLKDAYFMVPMSQQDKPLLKFQWRLRPPEVAARRALSPALVIFHELSKIIRSLDSRSGLEKRQKCRGWGSLFIVVRSVFPALSAKTSFNRLKKVQKSHTNTMFNTFTIEGLSGWIAHDQKVTYERVRKLCETEPSDLIETKHRLILSPFHHIHLTSTQSRRF